MTFELYGVSATGCHPPDNGSTRVFSRIGPAIYNINWFCFPCFGGLFLGIFHV